MRAFVRPRRTADSRERRRTLVAERLVRAGMDELSHPPPPLGCNLGIADAWLLDLAEQPHAFVLACALQSIERAPGLVLYRLASRLGFFDLPRLAGLTATDLVRTLSTPSAVAEHPEPAAARIASGVQRIVSIYDGDASRIWSGMPSSATLVRRLVEFEGVSREIAIAAGWALVRDHRVRVADRASLDLVADRPVLRVMARLGLLAEGAGADAAVYVAREIYPLHPAVIECGLVELARTSCAEEPRCAGCAFANACEYAITAQGAGHTHAPFAARG